MFDSDGLDEMIDVNDFVTPNKVSLRESLIDILLFILYKILINYML